MQENVTLIKEINDLRRELSQARSRVHDLEAALGLHANGRTQAAAANALATAATTTNKNAVMQLELDEKSKIVEMQTSEIMRLRGELMDLERAAAISAASRPSSATRLPPVSPPVGAQ